MGGHYLNQDEIRDLLAQSRHIALVGYSANPGRPSNGVARFLAARGYRVTPVNPGLAGQEHLGQRVAADLADLPLPADIVDVFRQGSALPALVDALIGLQWRPRALWLQFDVRHPEAEAAALAAGIDIVADRCSKVDYMRHFGTTPLMDLND